MHVKALPVRHFYNHRMRRRFMEPLLAAIEEADMVCGHNIVRFDLPVLRGEALELGLPRLGPVLAEDTIRLRGVRHKKGQDVLAQTMGVPEEKLPLNWSQWEAAYGEKNLDTVIERVAGDVRQHQALRAAMRERGWLPKPVMSR